MILHIHVHSAIQDRLYFLCEMGREINAHRSHGGDGGSAKGENIGRRVTSRLGFVVRKYISNTVKLTECWHRVCSDTESDLAFYYFLSFFVWFKGYAAEKKRTNLKHVVPLIIFFPL